MNKIHSCTYKLPLSGQFCFGAQPVVRMITVFGSTLLIIQVGSGTNRFHWVGHRLRGIVLGCIGSRRQGFGFAGRGRFGVLHSISSRFRLGA